MATVIYHTCDRCAANIRSENNLAEVWIDSKPLGRRGIHIDLCPECTDKLWGFMGIDPKEIENERKNGSTSNIR